MKDRVICLSFILFVFFFGIVVKLFQINTNSPKEGYIGVSVKGAVVKPGTYFCRYGESVAKILEAACGMTENGYLPEGFDYNTPITDDIVVNIPNRYSSIRKNFEEN